MGKRCFTCRRKYKYMDNVERKSVKGLNANFFKTDQKLGDLLKAVGVKFSRKDDWDTLICCRKCWSILKQWNTLNQKANDLSARWQQQTKEKLPVFAKPERKVGSFKTQAARYIQCSEYGKAINVLRRYSQAARSAWLRGVARTVMKEMIALEKEPNLIKGLLNWEQFLTVVEGAAPTLYYVLVSALSRKGDLTHGTSRKQSLGAPRLGTMLQIALHHRRPKLHKLLPSYIAAALWGPGSKQRVACIKSVKALGFGRRAKNAKLKATKQAKPRVGRLPVPYHEELARGQESGIQWRLESGSPPSSPPHKAKKTSSDKFSSLQEKYSSLRTDYEAIKRACDQLEEENKDHKKHRSKRASTDVVSTKTTGELTTTPEVGMEIDISQADSVEYVVDVPMSEKMGNVVTQETFEVTLASISLPEGE